MKKGDLRLTEIYDFIKNFSEDKGYPPSVRDIGAYFNIKSTSTVHYYLQKLRDKQLLLQEEGKNRAVVMSKIRSKANYLPVAGNVSAGQGILAVQNIENEFPLPADLFGGSNMFMLKVEGESMINAGISDGDYVVVQQQPTANIGEIVVVLWQDTATVKRLVRTAPTLLLHPENDFMDDIEIFPEDNPSILGKVVGCIKKF